MSDHHPAAARSKRPWLIAAAVVLVLGGGLYAFAQTNGDKVEALNTVKPSDEPTFSATTDATPSAEPTKESLDDGLFNVEGVEKSTLPADKGESSGNNGKLGLACGGTYPKILFKTVSKSAKTSLCGETTSGENLRMVTRQGGTVYDMPAEYDYVADAFVAHDGATTYILEGYSGDLIVQKNGTSKRQSSTDWISLDNESDYD